MSKLLSARFLISVIVTLVACYGFVLERISGELFVSAWILIINFYFFKKREVNK